MYGGFKGGGGVAWVVVVVGVGGLRGGGLLGADIGVMSVGGHN